MREPSASSPGYLTSPTDLRHHLSVLERSGLIHLVRAGQDLEYHFHHALLQEAAYRSLVREDRRRLHQAVGRTLERLAADQSEELAPVLAQHFQEAGDAHRTLKYSAQAGDWAMRQYAAAEAAAHYSRAIGASRALGASPVGLLQSRGLAYELLGQFDRALTDYQAALDLAREAGDRPTEWQTLLRLGHLWASRDYSKTGEYFQEALELSRKLDDPAAVGRSLNRVGNWHTNLESAERARQHHLEALSIFERLGDRRNLAVTLDLLGMASSFDGDVIRGREYFHEAAQLFRQQGDRHGLVSSMTSLSLSGAIYADTVVAASHVTQTVEETRQALAMAQDIRWPAGEAYAQFALAFCLTAAGKYGGALEAARDALHISEEIGHRQWMAASSCALGVVYCELLTHLLAIQYLTQALGLAKETGSAYWTGQSAGWLATSYLLKGEAAQAESVLDSALGGRASARSLGGRRYLCTCGELALARGEFARAVEIAEMLVANTPQLATGRVAPRIWKLRGEALAGLGRFEEARSDLNAAVETAWEQGARSIGWKIRLPLAVVLRACGRSPEASPQVEAATATVKELGEDIPDPALRKNFLSRAGELIAAASDQNTSPSALIRLNLV